MPTAAAGYALALAQQPDDQGIAIRAYREAIASGDLALIRQSIETLRKDRALPSDAALLVMADHLASGQPEAAQEALGALKSSPLDFLSPILQAWIAYDRDPAVAASSLNQGPAGAIGRRYANESLALMQIGRGEAALGVQTLLALGQTGRSGMDVRLSAVPLLSSSAPELASALLTGDDPVLSAYRSDTPAPRKLDARYGASRLFTRLGGELTMDGTEPLAMVLARAALILDPDHHRARLILADNLAREGAIDLALAQLADIPAANPFRAAVPGARIALLRAAGRLDAALIDARSVTAGAGATANDWQVLADLLSETGDHLAAADAYGQAARRTGGDDWVLALQQGGALERGGRWREALPLLRRAVQLAPDEPLALNYLGYAQIERGENVKAARKLLERAAALSPDNMSILDSLGWAYFLTGDVGRALPLLERAARGEPADSTIQEHLGDAYWRLGRRYEARYAWRAATLYADDGVAERLATKIAVGPGND